MPFATSPAIPFFERPLIDRMRAILIDREKELVQKKQDLEDAKERFRIGRLHVLAQTYTLYGNVEECERCILCLESSIANLKANIAKLEAREQAPSNTSSNDRKSDDHTSASSVAAVSDASRRPTP